MAPTLTDSSSALAYSERLMGRTPFSWQSRLLTEYLLAGSIPDAVEVPTGLGKTAVIALWLAALAAGARLPRRLVYVVDRRAVVDQATVEAEQLADVLGDGSGATDADVAALRERLGLTITQRFAVSTLRGQYADNRRWMEDPSLPSIIVGTVDMIGSRLLFGGYGVSRRMRPVHAGLLAADALLVLDEAHLVPPFEALVRRIQRLRAEDPVEIPQFRVMALSATQRDAEGIVFRLNDEDEKDVNAARRLTAAKSVVVHARVGEKQLADAMATKAWHAAHPCHALLVFCNKRTVAQAVHSLLSKRIKAAGTSIPIELLVGERRAHERQLVASSPAFRRFMPGRHANGSVPVTPAFLVATSAGEVGVDLDADHMVCDLVEWERMLQRFGRVNRRPEPAPGSNIDVIPVLDDKRKVGYGEPPEERLDRLRAPFEHPLWPIEQNGRRSASPKRLQQLKLDSDFNSVASKAQTPEPLRPALTMGLVDAWAMTSLSEHSGRPNVQPWIRGWIDDEPQARLVWRRMFPITGNPVAFDGSLRANLDAFFDAAPPHMIEVLEAPSHRAVEVLKRRADAWSKRGGATDRHPPVVVGLKPDGTVERCMTLDELAAEKADRLVRDISGRTLIVDARLGGLGAHGLLDPDEGTPPLTIDSVDPVWAGFGPRIGFRIVDGETELHAAWRVEYQWYSPSNSGDDDVLSIRVDVWRDGIALRGDPAVARRAQELEVHQRWVVDEIGRIAERLGVGEKHRRGLELAAAHHDAGKGRALWQRAMGAPGDGKVYAKTIGRTNPRLLTIGGRSFRHEFGSLGELLQIPGVASLDDEVADLALHLVAVHHGYGRPLIAPVDPEYPPSVLESRAQHVALRFHRVHRRWGAWGLAWWEAVFRAADRRASQRLNNAEPK